MANVCTFEMRIRGTKENCYKMVNSDIPCYDAYIADEYGTDSDYMVYVNGECRWSVRDSMVNTEDKTLAQKAEEFDIELEVVGYDISEPEWVQHYHYKGAECLKEYVLIPCFPEYIMDEMDISDEDKEKYTLIEEHGMYVIKEEFQEPFEWDEENERMTVNYAMSFNDLEGYEEPEEDEEEEIFGGKAGILAMMGITPDENGFAIKRYDSGEATLFEYFGDKKIVNIPDYITEIEEGCLSENETVEQIYVPESVKYIGEDCFTNCPKLIKIITPEGSAAEKYAEENGILVINE